MSPFEISFPTLPPGFSRHEFDQFMIFCYEKDVSDVRIQSGDRIFAFIHGRKIPATPRNLQHNEVMLLASFLYGDNAAARLGSGVDLDPRYAIDVSRGKKIGFRVNLTACYVNGNENAVSVTMRFLPGQPRKLSTLLVPKELAEAMLQFAQGIVIVAGVTGSGKSTLLAGVMREVLETGRDECINTYESPIEYVYDGIVTECPMPSQVEIGKHLPTFAAGVRNSMRRAPTIILIGESRDRETIESSIEAALTGHKCYTTVHADSVGGVVSRMLSQFSGTEQAAMKEKMVACLEVVVVQKLLKTATGRTPAREWMCFNKEIKEEIILSSEPVNVILDKMVRTRGTSMVHYCKYLYDKGLVSLADAALGASMKEDVFLEVIADEQLFTS